MPLTSMTGFARRDGRELAGDGMAWTWEVKSVNGKALEVRCRLPQGFDALEPAARAAAPKHLSRGNVSISLSVRQPEREPKLRVNRDMLAEVLDAVADYQNDSRVGPPAMDGLLRLPGVLERFDPDELAGEDAMEARRRRREAALAADLEAVFADLAAARSEEGVRLHGVISNHLRTIESLVSEAATAAETRNAGLADRLREQVAALIDASPALSEDRLAQEAALLAVKADIREEIDRLKAHVAQARELIESDEAVGRRLDFLCQEFNREANTLCSKSASVDLTRIGLSLKASIDQLREQVQNVE